MCAAFLYVGMRIVESFSEAEIVPRDELPVSEKECPCYKCSEQLLYVHEDGFKEVVNNMEYHTYGEDCRECGESRTVFRDLGRKGRFVCPDC